jgi:hypothetical protein
MDDAWSTDTADPARVFRMMFPPIPPRLDWRIFTQPGDWRRWLEAHR